MNLAAGQAAIRAVVAVAAAGPEIVRAVHLSSSPLNWLRDVWPNWDSPVAVALVTWTALGPGSLSFVLQMYAQSTVAAPAAQARSPCNTHAMCAPCMPRTHHACNVRIMQCKPLTHDAPWKQHRCFVVVGGVRLPLSTRCCPLDLAYARGQHAVCCHSPREGHLPRLARRRAGLQRCRDGHLRLSRAAI